MNGRVVNVRNKPFLTTHPTLELINSLSLSLSLRSFICLFNMKVIYIKLVKVECMGVRCSPRAIERQAHASDMRDSSWPPS